MAWKCVDCGQSDELGGSAGRDTAVNGVCVHCGKPLCEYHGNVIADDAFGVAPNTTNDDNTAVHCSDCQRAHHPNAA